MSNHTYDSTQPHPQPRMPAANPTCWLCAQPGADTIDHVIPQSLHLADPGPRRVAASTPGLQRTPWQQSHHAAQPPIEEMVTVPAVLAFVCYLLALICFVVAALNRWVPGST